MANKNISIADRELVVQRLAEGQSTRQSIEGTSIASNQTAARIARTESHIITQRRQEYVKNIESRMLTTSMDNRICMLGQMMWAKKLIRRPLSNGINYRRTITCDEAFIEVEDWDTRFKAIQYIDKLEGLNSGNGLQINVLQQVNEG
jgi:hypothetical protein